MVQYTLLLFLTTYSYVLNAVPHAFDFQRLSLLVDEWRRNIRHIFGHSRQFAEQPPRHYLLFAHLRLRLRVSIHLLHHEHLHHAGALGLRLYEGLSLTISKCYLIMY